MDNPYMTAAFMNQFQTGLQNASQNFTNAYDRAADRRQNAYLRQQELETQRQRDEAQRAFEADLLAKRQTFEDTQGEKGFGRQVSMAALGHTFDTENAANRNVYDRGLKDLDYEQTLKTQGVHAGYAPQGSREAPYAAAFKPGFDADVTAKKANAELAGAHAEAFRAKAKDPIAGMKLDQKAIDRDMAIVKGREKDGLPYPDELVLPAKERLRAAGLIPAEAPKYWGIFNGMPRKPTLTAPPTPQQTNPYLNTFDTRGVPGFLLGDDQ